MKKTKYYDFLRFYLPGILILIFGVKSYAQLNIVSSNVQSFNITPQSMCDVNIINNTQQPINILMTVKLFSQNNEELLKVLTNKIEIQPGLNVTGSKPILINNYVYSNSQLSNQLRAYQKLPLGHYRICVDITSESEEADQWCDELESDYLSFITLVNPFDQDTIDIDRPALTWSCSDFPIINTPTEYYKLVLTELMEDQSPDAAITENEPKFFKSGVSGFMVEYPVGTTELEKGKTYAWQVFKITGNQVIDKSEAWRFTVRPDLNIDADKYAVVKKQIDAGYYQPLNNKIYFKFKEDYPVSEFKCSFYDSKRNLVNPSVVNDINNDQVNIKKNGDNRFEIDLINLPLRNGFYLLEILNGKGEKFYLKFLIS